MARGRVRSAREQHHLQQQEIVDEAIGLAQRGWRVVPLTWPTDGGCSCSRGRACEAPAKHPTIKRWHKLGTTDPDQLEAWWREWPRAGVGIVTGRGSDLVALDVDPRNGGGDALHLLELSYEPLPQTPEVLTGGGGRGLLFAAPAQPVKNSSSMVGPGIDIRGEGGLVVMPPTMHASGNRYVWEVSGHPDDVTPAELPAWLLALLAQRPAKAGQDRPVGAPVAEGDRNRALTSLAGSMRRAGATVDAVRAALEVENQQRCRPPLDEGEVATIADSAARWPTGPPWITDMVGFVTDARLDVRSRMVLMVLALHANPDGLAHPGYRRICEVGGVAQNQIKRCTDRLEEAERIEVRRRSRRHGNLYRVLHQLPTGTSAPAGYAPGGDGGR